MFHFHWIGWYRVGVQSRGDEVLPELLRPGFHRTDALVTSIQLRRRIGLCFSDSKPRSEVRYELNADQLLSLYHHDEWRPVRAHQIPELVATVGLWALSEELAELSLKGVRYRSEEQLFRTYDILDEPQQRALRDRASKRLSARLQRMHPWVFRQVGIFVRPART